MDDQRDLGHIVDDERIYVTEHPVRAEHSTELPGFEQDHYAQYSEANKREITDLLDEFALVRRSTIASSRV